MRVLRASARAVIHLGPWIMINHMVVKAPDKIMISAVAADDNPASDMEERMPYRGQKVAHPAGSCVSYVDYSKETL